jgi:D-arabinose 1-dehydrogenase-like Zn-dependent alcohol dehydrogenase
MLFRTRYYPRATEHPHEKMRACVYAEHGDASRLEVKEIARPECVAGQLLVCVVGAGVNPVDIKLRDNPIPREVIPLPKVPGTDISGVVVEAPEGSSFKVGDRVTGEGHVTCGHCRNCRGGRQHLCINTYGIGVNRPGAFADLFTLPAGNAFKLPNGITDDIASVMDPLGNAVSGEKSLGMAPGWSKRLSSFSCFRLAHPCAQTCFPPRSTAPCPLMSSAKTCSSRVRAPLASWLQQVCP